MRGSVNRRTLYEEKLKEDISKATRISQQYRERDNMVYELRCGDSHLVLHACHAQNADSAEWRFEAHPRHAPELVVIGEGSTRKDALTAVRAAWIEKGTTNASLVAFDWDAVAAALTNVRALG